MAGRTPWNQLKHKSTPEQLHAARARAHEYEVEQLMGVGLTRVQAERHLAAARGENISDVIGSPADTPITEA